MIHLDKNKILQLITPNKDLIECVARGSIDERKGVYHVPERLHIDHDHGTLLVMPSISPSFSCTKVVQVNKVKNPSLVEGIITLSDAENGRVLMTLDAPIITNLRTGAIGALGLKLSTDKSIDSIGVIGSGEQAFWQVVFAKVVRKIDSVFIYSRNADNVQAIQQRLHQKFPELIIVPCKSPEEVYGHPSAIYLCTNALKPVLPNSISYHNKSLISIGSFTKEMQEIPDSAFANDVQIIIDSHSALKEVGDIINPIKKGLIQEDQIRVLGDVLQEKEFGNKCRLFKSVGQAAFDLALSVYIYKEYKRNTL